MYHRSRSVALVPIVLAATCVCIAGDARTSGAIGLATTQGVLVVDNAEVRGNAALLDGSTVQTREDPSQMTLRGGARIDLATESSGRVYRDHVVLERGTGKVRGVPVTVNGMRIVPQQHNAMIQVTTDGSKRFAVGATDGAASVLNSHGMLIAQVSRGEAMSFVDQDTGAGAPSQITGCIQRVKGTSNYVLRDETTNVVYQVTGPDVDANVGKSVQISGALDSTATPISGASQLIHENSLTPSGGKGCKSEIPAAAAAAAGGGGAAAAAGGGGGVSGATVAIIAGVAVAGVIGGLAAAGTFSSSSSSSTVSP
ncbi:MAG TPA: hypothetical protein VFA04_12260 [Bryobacteraceae bacterium]|nr:hypothetical protein [Bryobacteraceae bacterium]